MNLEKISLQEFNSVEEEVRCIVCESAAVPRFCVPYAGSTVWYCECPSCHHLTATEVRSRANYSGSEYFSDIDYGWEQRNAKILEMIRILLRLPGFKLNRHSGVLDYGCGKGRLVKGLRQFGLNAYGYEPFVCDSEDASVLRSITEIREKVSLIDMILLIEVIEHVTNPHELMDKLNSLLRPGGMLLLSTELYDERRCDSSWYYLNPSAGHVSIFSRVSLLHLMRSHGFVPVMRLNETLWLFSPTNVLNKRFFFLLLYLISAARVRLKPSNLFGGERVKRSDRKGHLSELSGNA